MKKFLIVVFSICFVCLSVFGIYTLAMSKIYPVKYKPYICEASEIYDLDPALVASIINVESRYKKDARSSKGAVGLMQLMPATAREMAKKSNYGEYTDDCLLHERSNILLGCCYLRTLLDWFHDEDLALMAYNAGPTTISNWLKDNSLSKDGITLVAVPYKETNEYLTKIHKNYKIYKSKY